MAGFINVPILSTYNDAGVKRAQASLQGLGGTVAGLGKSIKGAATAMIAFAAVTGTAAFVKNIAVQARDFERNMASVSRIFGTVTPQMQDFISTANTMGMSQSQAAQAVTFLGSVLRSSGFSAQTAADETKKLVGLAADLATVYGYDVSEALTGMSALFRGEYDPIEKFGVAMKQSQVNAELAARGMSNLTGAAKQQALQQVRLDLLYKNSTASLGAFQEQSGTLFVEQKKLEGAWNDFAAAVGQPLLPVLTEFVMGAKVAMEALQPSMTKLMGALGRVIRALQPLFPPLLKIIVIVVDLVADLLDSLAPLIETLSIALAPALEFTAEVVGGVAEALKWLVDLVVAAVVPVLNTLAGTLIIVLRLAGEMLKGLLEGPLGALLEWFGVSREAMKDWTNGFQDVIKQIGGFQKLLDGKPGTFNPNAFQFDLTGTDAGTTGKNYVADFFSSMEEEVRKQSAKMRLSALGASDALISRILGASGWESVFKKIVAGGASAVAALQATFNKTGDGLDELKKASDAAAEALQDYSDKMDALKQKTDDFVAGMAELVRGVSPLPTVTRQLGEFEQAVVDSFQSIYDSLKDAVNNKLLYQSSADDLAAYARNTQNTLAGIAAERDLIARKIQDANSLIESTRNAVIGFVNINSMLTSEAKTVTETAVSMIDGIRLTLTRSFDVQTLSGNVADGFRKILDRTKKFAADLKSLKAMGLDKGLFTQIVEAGLDAGSATAEAILAGGQGTVDELNSLFDELGVVGTDIAEQTAQVMYGAGVDVTNGLIEGLLSQSDALQRAAQTLADAFAATFQSRLDAQIQLDALALSGIEAPVEAVPSGGGINRGIPLMMMSNRQPVQNTYTVEVNAGVIADPGAVGQAVVNEIVRYERNNGSVWLRA